jgi:hypothetical protein
MTLFCCLEGECNKYTDLRRDVYAPFLLSAFVNFLMERQMVDCDILCCSKSETVAALQLLH